MEPCLNAVEVVIDDSDVTPWTRQIQSTVAMIPPRILPSSDGRGVDLLQYLGSRSGLQHDWLHHLVPLREMWKSLFVACLKELSLTA